MRIGARPEVREAPLRRPSGPGRTPLFPVTFGGLLLVAAGGVAALSCSDDEAFDWRATQLRSLPSFVMELETFSGGNPHSTIVLNWVSGDEWLWEVFDADGSLSSSAAPRVGPAHHHGRTVRGDRF